MLQYLGLIIKYFQVEFTVGLSLREQSFIYLFRSLIVGLSGLPGLSGLSRLSRLSGLPRLSRLSRLSRSSGLSGLSDRRDRRDRKDRPTIRICEAIVLQLTNNYNAIITTDVRDKEKKRKRVKIVYYTTYSPS